MVPATYAAQSMCTMFPATYTAQSMCTVHPTTRSTSTQSMCTKQPQFLFSCHTVVGHYLQHPWHDPILSNPTQLPNPCSRNRLNSLKINCLFELVPCSICGTLQLQTLHTASERIQPPSSMLQLHAVSHCAIPSRAMSTHPAQALAHLPFYSASWHCTSQGSPACSIYTLPHYSSEAHLHSRYVNCRTAAPRLICVLNMLIAALHLQGSPACSMY
eukprot:1157763-Pelagomonas_calceolata.AAC.7